MAVVHQIDVEHGQIINQPQISSHDEQIPTFDERRAKYQLDLYRVALRGDWEAAIRINIEHENCFAERISILGDTALHIAAARGQTHFVKQILPYMQSSSEQLKQCNNKQNTAFCLAAASGALEMVKEMERLNPSLPYITGSSNIKPIVMAALLGHRKVVMYLLRHFEGLSSDDRIDLLISTINTDLYDVALQILEMDDRLAIARNDDGKTALYVLAQKTPKQNVSQLSNWRRIGNMLFSSLWGEQQEDQTKLKLVENLWKLVIRRPQSDVLNILSSPEPKLLFVAIEMGNYEFVALLMRYYPDLLWEIDDDYRTIFHAAVEYRQEKIFSHIRQLDGINHLLTGYKNRKNGNNILHLAATLPPPERLNVVSGPALQMQRELLWFQVVEEVVRCEYAGMKNKNNETPRAMFTSKHKELRDQGEKWMRETAKSCMLVATLVTAVVFQAVFQKPSDQNIILFLVFVISDAVSLVTSTASILTFLAILTSTYKEEDFLVGLPLMLMTGLSLLSCSIMTMLIAFTVTIGIIFDHTWAWVTIAILAAITCICYILRLLPLLVDVYSSTFRSGYLFHPRQELFQSIEDALIV